MAKVCSIYVYYYLNKIKLLNIFNSIKYHILFLIISCVFIKTYQIHYEVHRYIWQDTKILCKLRSRSVRERHRLRRALISYLLEILWVSPSSKRRINRWRWRVSFELADKMSNTVLPLICQNIKNVSSWRWNYFLFFSIFFTSNFSSKNKNIFFFPDIVRYLSKINWKIHEIKGIRYSSFRAFE